MQTWAGEPGRLRAEYARQWLTLLDGPLAELKNALVEDAERMRTLRSCTPFVGVLTDQQRADARRAVASG
jgi:hypothetical protein